MGAGWAIDLTQGGEGAPVRFGDATIVVLYDLPGLATGAERARLTTRALEGALHEYTASDLKVLFQSGPVNNQVGEVVKVYAGDRLLLRLAEADALHAGRNDFRVYANQVFQKIRELFKREHQRSVIAKQVLAVSTVVFLGLMALLLLRALRAFAKRARHFVRQEHVVGAVRLGAIELLPPGAAREATRVTFAVGAWVVQLMIVYAWVVTSLSLFDATRHIAEGATGSLLAPAFGLLSRLAGQVPVLVALVFSLLAVGLTVRFTTAYFSAIESGEIEVDWLRPEAARITGHLLSMGIMIGALLFVAPLLTGSDSGVFTRIGELLLGILALSITPMLASCALGVRLVYTHLLRRGDKISYGGHVGFVERVGVFDLVLTAQSGVTIRVPHLFSLWHATQLFPRSSAPDVTPSATVSEDKAHS